MIQGVKCQVVASAVIACKAPTTEASISRYPCYVSRYSRRIDGMKPIHLAMQHAFFWAESTSHTFNRSSP